MRIIFFQRKSFANQFSIEKVFNGLIEQYHARPDVNVELQVMPFHSVRFLPRLRNVLWSKKYQGHVNHITGDVHYIALGMQKRKTILTIHDLNFLNHPNPVARFILKTFWLTLPLRHVAYVTVISEATKRDLLSRIVFPEEQIRVIPNYYNSSFQYSPKAFNKDQPRLLQIGTKSNKNILRLIEALAGLNCHLVIVGADNNAIRQSLDQHGVSFTWLKNLTDKELQEQYRQCDVLTFVSTIEGFGMPILEAQATGRVVVTSNVSSMPEVAGEAACYVDPLDVTSIRKGIDRVITDDDYREALIQKGLMNVHRFDLSRIASMYQELYEAVYKRNTP